MRALPGYLDAMFLGSAYYAPGGPGATAPAAVAYYATAGAALEPAVPHPLTPLTDQVGTTAAMPVAPLATDLVSLGLAHPLWLLGGALALYWLVIKQ